jgi:hypothetical protein
MPFGPSWAATGSPCLTSVVPSEPNLSCRRGVNAMRQLFNNQKVVEAFMHIASILFDCLTSLCLRGKPTKGTYVMTGRELLSFFFENGGKDKNRLRFHACILLYFPSLVNQHLCVAHNYRAEREADSTTVFFTY